MDRCIFSLPARFVRRSLGWRPFLTGISHLNEVAGYALICQTGRFDVQPDVFVHQRNRAAIMVGDRARLAQ